ncbi:hypothetical protein [Salibacterium halotolerans]|uniref:hypothetical protein n=1 Tax=Salibacterium halotolerans TaxID=1884432 RepID=UPI000B886BDA|nr:hypothetical protein [Salibacterium halotolerans]
MPNDFFESFGILRFLDTPLRQNALLLLQSTRAASIRWGSSCLLCTPEYKGDIDSLGLIVSSLPRARLASAVPPDQLLVETDGPRPFQGPFAGIEATPELLRDVITTPTGITGEKVADPAVRMYGSSLGMGHKAL